MGVAVVRRRPSFLEELGQRFLPGLLGMAIEDGRRQQYATAEQGLYQDLYNQVQQAPASPPVNFASQAPANALEQAYGIPQGGGEASWLNTWDAAHSGTNDPMAILGQALQSDFARKYGPEAAMKGYQNIMGVADAQKQARIAAANRSGMDSMATHMGSQGYDYRSPHQVMPDWIRYGMYGGNQADLTNVLKHLSPNMQYQDVDLGNQKMGMAFDPGQGTASPLFQAPVGVSPDTPLLPGLRHYAKSGKSSLPGSGEGERSSVPDAQRGLRSLQGGRSHGRRHGGSGVGEECEYG